MSLAATIWARKQRVGNGIAKAVLMALADHANDDNGAWPSQDTLADETDFSVRAVRDALKLLETRGYLSRQKRGSWKRGRMSDKFTIAVGEQVGSEINRHPTPENDLPAPHVDLPAPRAGEPTKNLYPSQEGGIPRLVGRAPHTREAPESWTSNPFGDDPAETALNWRAVA